jgi:hypothetical protein
VKNAFLHGTLSETIYCIQPIGFVDPALLDRACLLNKSLYGLKQAPQAWYSWFVMYITSLGLVNAKSDTSLFVFRCNIDTVYLLLYIDDIVLTTSNVTLLQQTISALKREFAMKDLGPSIISWESPYNIRLMGSSSLSVSLFLIFLSELAWWTTSRF